MCAGGSLEDGQRTGGQLVRLEYTYFVFTAKMVVSNCKGI
jgi:hypothetical protein